MSELDITTAWWQTKNPPEGAWIEGRIGHLVLALLRHGNEWNLEHRYSDTRITEISWSERHTTASDPNPSRFLFETATGGMELRPALADLPVIARPRAEITVPARNTTRVFIGTPLWVQLREETQAALMAEFCTEQLSQTWFGPKVSEGELCYSTATAARLHFENLPELPDYAVTTVQLRNESSEPLRFNQIKLPVRALSVFRDRNGLHVTEPVAMTQPSEGPTEVSIDREAPLADWERVGAPRDPGESNLLTQTLTSLFD